MAYEGPKFTGNDPTARENDLLKRALAGDTKAKAEIEAKELMQQADARTMDLRNKAASGDTAAMKQLRALASGAAAPRTATGSGAAGRFSQVDMDCAVAAAVAKERQRIATVFDCPDSHGRERGCANILASPKNFSAAAITRELPHLPNDRERAAAGNRKQSDDIWAKAYSGSANDDSEAKAARILAAQAKYGVNAPRLRQESADPWDRAYAANGRGR